MSSFWFYENITEQINIDSSHLGTNVFYILSYSVVCRVFHKTLRVNSFTVFIFYTALTGHFCIHQAFYLFNADLLFIDYTVLKRNSVNLSLICSKTAL